MIATERGESSAWRSAARSLGVISILLSAARNGAAVILQIFAAGRNPARRRPVIRHASVTTTCELEEFQFCVRWLS